jgi:hypothetical protein
MYSTLEIFSIWLHVLGRASGRLVVLAAFIGHLARI